MGFLDWLLPDRPEPQEKFSAQWSASDPAFAAWWFGNTQNDQETVTPYTVLGLSAVLRCVQIISTTIASLPLKTYEKQGDARVRVPSVFDDPYPGIDGLTPFAWVETVLMHLLLWREAYLWHDDIAAGGTVRVYRPILPDAFTVKRENGKRLFEFTENGEKHTVGSEQITYIPGPSLDGVRGHPLLYAARSIFSAAISGDKTAQTVLKRGIRLAGLLTPGDENEDFDATEGEAILEKLRANVVGRENAGDVALINRRLKLQPWTPNNIESQWHETRGDVLGEIGRLFGVPPHLINDIERQTSWGTGVSEQNLGLARYTLMGWTSRIEQILNLRLPRNQFVEFDYKGLLQGTPAAEIALIIDQIDAGLLTQDEARVILNRPPIPASDDLSTRVEVLGGLVRAGFDPAESARALGLPKIKHLGVLPVTVQPPEKPAPPQLLPDRQAASDVPIEPSRFAELVAYAQLQRNGHSPDVNVTVEPSQTHIHEGAIKVTPPEVRVESPVTFDKGAIQVDAPVTVERTEVHVDEGAVQVPVTVEPAQVHIAEGAVKVDSPVTVERDHVTVEAPAVTVEPSTVTVDVHIPEPKPVKRKVVRDKGGAITHIEDS